MFSAKTQQAEYSHDDNHQTNQINYTVHINLHGLRARDRRQLSNARLRQKFLPQSVGNTSKMLWRAQAGTKKTVRANLTVSADGR
jgi:hypothetical protein